MISPELNHLIKRRSNLLIRKPKSTQSVVGCIWEWKHPFSSWRDFGHPLSSLEVKVLLEKVGKQTLCEAHITCMEFTTDFISPQGFLDLNSFVMYWLRLRRKLAAAPYPSPHVTLCALLCSSSRMVMPPSLPSTPSGPLTRMGMAPLTSESSSVLCPSPPGAALSRSSTGPSTCMTWMVMARSPEWRCWRSLRWE